MDKYCLGGLLCLVPESRRVVRPSPVSHPETQVDAPNISNSTSTLALISTIQLPTSSSPHKASPMSASPAKRTSQSLDPGVEDERVALVR